MKIIVDLNLDQMLQGITDNSHNITAADVPPDPVASFRYGVTYALARIRWLMETKFAKEE